MIQLLVQNRVDELFNRPEYNIFHRETRHLVNSKHIFRKSNIEDFVIDIIDLFPDNSQEIERNNKEGYIAIQQWLESFLKLKEVEMFMTIEMKGMAIKEYARLNNIKPNTVTQKSKRMRNKIKINYEKCHI